MQSVAGGRLGAVLRHLSKMFPHKPLNVLPCQISTQVTDRMLSGVNVVSKDTVSCSHVFRPWDFDDFERLATVPLGTIVNQMVLTSYLIGKHYFFQPPKECNNEPVFSLVFIRGQSWEFLPPYHRHLAPGRGTAVTEKLSFLGNTSWLTMEEIRDSSSNDLMAKGIIQRINVSATTRKPEQLPDWLKERYTYLTSTVPRPPTVQSFDVPTHIKCFRYSIVVAPSDTDSNHHTNQAPYIWYCMDCATLGARSGAYSVLSGDLAKYNLKMLEVLYQNESLEGDILDIESWEDQDSPDTLRFQVKKGNENITQLTMQFYLQTV